MWGGIWLGYFTAAARLPPEILVDKYLGGRSTHGYADKVNVMKKMWLVSVTLLVTATWSPAQQKESLNRTLVEIGKLVMSAKSANSPETAISLLDEAHGKLLSIVEDYPSSDAAVKLATGQGIGSLSLASVRDAIRAETQKCWESPSLFCVSRLIVDRAQLYPESNASQEDAVAAIFRAASAQVKLGAWEDARKTVEIAASFVSKPLKYPPGGSINWRGHSGYMGYPAAIPLAEAEIRFLAASARSTEPIEDAAKRAVKAIEAIEDSDDRIKALTHFASVQRKAGNAELSRTTFDQAVEAAETIKDSDDRVGALIRIAWAQRKAGHTELSRETLDRAVEATESINGSWDRVWRLSAIASAQSKAGYVEDSQATFDRAVKVAKSILDLYDKGYQLANIALAQANLGDEEVARATIQAAETAVALRDALTLAHTYTAVALAQTETGNIEGARMSLREATKAADSFTDSNIRTERLRAIVSAAVEAELFTDATKVAMLIDDSEGRASALAKVALAQAEAGKKKDAGATIDAALEPAKRIDDPIERGHARADIALARAKTGDLEGCLEAINLVLEPGKLIDDPEKRGHVLADIAVVQAKTGNVEDSRATIDLALEAVEAIESANNRAYVLGIVATAQAVVGNKEDSKATIDLALKFALSVEDDNQRTARLRQSVTSRVETGHFAEAVEVAKLIKDGRQQAYSLAETALAQTEANDGANARETITLAAEAAKTSEASADALADIATAQAKSGMVREAEATFRDALKDIDSRNYFFPGAMLAKVALAQAKMRNIEEARTTIDRAINALKTGWARKRARALTKIAEAQVKVEDLEGAKTSLKKALTSAMSVEDVYKKFSILGDVAQQQIQAGNIEGAQVIFATKIVHLESLQGAEAKTLLLWANGIYFELPIIESDQLDQLLKLVKSRAEASSLRESQLTKVLKLSVMNHHDLSGPAAAVVTRTASHVHEELKKGYLPAYMKDDILQVLASSHAAAHQFAEALDTAKLIYYSGERIKSFATTALAQKKAGNIEDARSTFGMADRLARSMSDDTDSWDLINLADAQIEAGLVSGASTNLRRALRTARSEKPWKQLVGLKRLLDALLLIEDSGHD